MPAKVWLERLELAPDWAPDLCRDPIYRVRFEARLVDRTYVNPSFYPPGDRQGRPYIVLFHTLSDLTLFYFVLMLCNTTPA